MELLFGFFMNTLFVAAGVSIYIVLIFLVTLAKELWKDRSKA